MKTISRPSPTHASPWLPQPERQNMQNEELKQTARESEPSADDTEAQDMLEEIEIEELTVDGICGVY